MIDELEIQLEEAHRTAAHGSDSLESHTSTARDPSSYKIDDATLRQLFLSYLTAPRDKQPEIAMVMSSILGYGPEVTFRLAVGYQAAVVVGTEAHTVVAVGIGQGLVRFHAPGRAIAGTFGTERVANGTVHPVP